MEQNNQNRMPQWVAIPGLVTAALLINMGTLQADDSQSALVDYAEKNRQAITKKMNDRLQKMVTEVVWSQRLEQATRQMLSASERSDDCAPALMQTATPAKNPQDEIQG